MTPLCRLLPREWRVAVSRGRESTALHRNPLGPSHPSFTHEALRHELTPAWRHSHSHDPETTSMPSSVQMTMVLYHTYSRLLPQQESMLNHHQTGLLSSPSTPTIVTALFHQLQEGTSQPQAVTGPLRCPLKLPSLLSLAGRPASPVLGVQLESQCNGNHHPPVHSSVAPLAARGAAFVAVE